MWFDYTLRDTDKLEELTSSDKLYSYNGDIRSDGRIIKQSNGLKFIYDGAVVVGVNYNGTQYLYRKDAQGNIVALLDSDGNVVVNYSYDAWGNHGVEVVDSACATLAQLNPFRELIIIY